VLEEFRVEDSIDITSDVLVADLRDQLGKQKIDM